MARKPDVTIERLTPDQLLALPSEEFQALILCGEPLVFRAGSAEILERFWVTGNRLILEFGHIDGGGEGILPTLASMAIRYSRENGLSTLEWRVHAINCPNPNLKLRRLLDRRGFRVSDLPGSGKCYHLVEPIGSTVDSRAGYLAPSMACRDDQRREVPLRDEGMELPVKTLRHRPSDRPR